MAGRKKGPRVAGHKADRTKGSRRCRHCKGKHTTSQHWSHSANQGKKSFKHSFGGTKGGKRRRKGTYHGSPGDFAGAARAIKAGKLGRSKQTRKGGLTKRERSALNKARHKKAQMSKHSVRGHLAKNPKSAGQHRVKKHTAKNPKRSRKK